MPKKPDPTGDEGALDTLATGRFTIRGLFILCGLLLTTTIMGPVLTVYILHEPTVVIDPNDDGSVTIARAQRFDEALFFVKQSAEMAAKAMLMRGPGGVEDPDTITLMFNAKTQDTYSKLIEDQSPLFHDYSYHQKPEFDPMKIVADPDGTFRSEITGHLIRVGTYNGGAKLDTVSFQLILYFVRNTDVAINKRYPLVVWNFDYKESRSQ